MHDDVIKKYGGFGVILGHYGGSKWQNFTNDPIFIIYFSLSFRWNNKNFLFKTFRKSCLQGFVLKSDFIKKWNRMPFFSGGSRTHKGPLFQIQPHSFFSRLKPNSTGLPGPQGLQVKMTLHRKVQKIFPPALLAYENRLWIPKGLYRANKRRISIYRYTTYLG